jgi:hypothetical protein
MNLVSDLRRHRAKHFSQNGEDGVIARLLEILGAGNTFYVEIGAGCGQECNTRWLRENGWSGIMLDSNCSDPTLDLYQEFVTAENVIELLTKYGAPGEFGVLSIDIDGNDYWVCKAILKHFQPRIIVVEFNAALPSNIAVSMPYDPLHRWVGQPYVGQSLLAVQKLGAEYGYSLVFAAPPNAFLALRARLPADYVEISASRAMNPVIGWIVRIAPLLVRFQNRRWNEELRRHPWVYI